MNKRKECEIYFGFMIMIIVSVLKNIILKKPIDLFEIIISVGSIILSKIIAEQVMKEVDKQLNKKNNKKN